MKRDPLFYQFFKEAPECFFRLIGHPKSEAKRYRMEAPELKESSVRLDGVFTPFVAGDPVYIWEAQYYPSEKVYANLLSKIGRYLDHGDPTRDWIAVVIYPTRSMEQKNLHPYRCLLNSDQLIRVYIEDLPPAKPGDLEMEVLELIAANPKEVLAKAPWVYAKVQETEQPEHYRRMLRIFIESIVLAHDHKITRDEVRKMLNLKDWMDVRAIRETHEEAEKLTAERIARAMLDRGDTLADVMDVTGVSKNRLQEIGKKRRPSSTTGKRNTKKKNGPSSEM